jgi:hypothetical protein
LLFINRKELSQGFRSDEIGHLAKNGWTISAGDKVDERPRAVRLPEHHDQPTEAAEVVAGIGPECTGERWGQARIGSCADHGAAGHRRASTRCFAI